MGLDSNSKAEKKDVSSEKKNKHAEKDVKHKKQHNNYSKLEGGEKPRISPEELGDLVAEADTDALKQYDGVKGVAGAIGSDLERGLSEGDLERQKSSYGENRPPEKPSRGFFSFVWDAVQDKTLIILAVCAGISIGLGVTVEKDKSTGWIDGAAILAAVFIVVMVTACNDFSKDKKFRKLSEIRDEKQVTVVRDGEQKSISVFDVLVGDVVELEPGAPIPADGLYISGQGVTSDESPMTGESDSVRKDDEDPFMLSGCTILEGVCQMLVVAVGPNSQKGKISALLDSPNEDTPLTTKLEHLANQIGKFGLIAAVLTLAILLIKYTINFRQEHKSWAWSELGTIVQYLISAITIVVVAVPEGLPLAVTISLAYSMMKMMKDQNLVRHLEACETMGGATNICSDKTGTLTENRMTVDRLWLCGNEMGGEEGGNPKELDEKVAHLFTEGIAVNSNAYLSKGKKKEKDGDDKTKEKKKSKEQREMEKAMEAAKERQKEADGGKERLEFVGNKTECALLEYMATQMEVNYEEIRKKHKKNIAKLYPFSSERKMMSTAIRTEEGDAKYILYCKGASEIILEECSTILKTDGEADLKDKKRDEISDLIEEYASSGLRTIGLAYKEFSEEPDWEDDEEVIKDLVFLGLAGIKDPVRKEVPEAVEKCKNAGIMVRMITGDNILTARHIAKECGILTEDGIAIEGPKFRKMTEAELDEIIPKLQVIARAQPQDKYTLVHRLRELGEVVAVTGDGVNDAPQLKEADVGFAMGITGTEVAKDASDIVLLDDNFSSIVKAVMWGRNVYDSIRKFIQFQLTVNLVAVAIAFIGSVTNGASPLTPVQLLWVNLIMDTFAALALATERPSEELLDRKPYGRYDHLITRAMWRNIISQAVFQLGVLLVMLYAIDIIPFVSLPPKSDTERWNLERNTFLFNTFVMCQLFNEINSRKLGNELNVFTRFFTNPIFLGVMAITLVGQFLLIQFAGSFASTVPLSINQWIVSVVIGAISLPYGLIIRLAIRLKEPEPKKPTPEEIKKEQEKAKKKDKKKNKNGEEEEEKPDISQIGKQIKSKREKKGTKDTGKSKTTKDKDGEKKTTKVTKDSDGEDVKKEKKVKSKDGDEEVKEKKVKSKDGDKEVKEKKVKSKDGDEEEKEKKVKSKGDGVEKTEKKEKKKKSSDSDSDSEDGKERKEKKEKKQKDSEGETKKVIDSNGVLRVIKKGEEDTSGSESDSEEKAKKRKERKEKGEKEEKRQYSSHRDLELGVRSASESESESEKAERRRKEKGKAPVRSPASDKISRSARFDERSTLLPKGERKKSLVEEHWGTAAQVLTQVSVINALRNQRRRSMIYSYPTKKNDEVTLADHRRRISRQLSARRQSRGNINNNG